MDPEALLFELKQVFEKLGVEVREQNLESDAGRAGSGLVRMHGKQIVFLENLLPAEEKIKILAGILKQFDLEGIFLSPYLRSWIEAGNEKD